MQISELLLVLGVLAFCTIPLLSIIFGIVGLVKIGRSGGQLRGAGLAWTGIIIGVISLLAVPAVGGLALVSRRSQASAWEAETALKEAVLQERKDRKKRTRAIEIAPEDLAPTQETTEKEGV